MPRFFVERENVDIAGGRVTITDDARHISRSLRMAVGDNVTVCDGSSNEYFCKLLKIRDDICECEIISVLEGGGESPLSITLCMAYPKGDKLETVIQKAVELGASRIIPFESSRCIKRPKAEKLDRVTARLQRIAEEAAKQCGRSRIPEVTAPMSYPEMLGNATDADLSLFCYEGEDENSLANVLFEKKDIKSVCVIVGSEGGFSRDEAEAAVAKGCVSVTLGKRILRCETAPSYVLSVLSYVYEK